MKIIRYQSEYKSQVENLIKESLFEIFGKHKLKPFEKFEDYDLFYIAKKKQKVIGTIAIKGNKIKRLYVQKRYRNKGIAQKLFNLIEKYAIQQNLSTLKLSTTPEMIHAIRFYEKNGFKKTEIDTKNNQIFFIKEIKMPCKKIYILGLSASGKTTFATKLSKKLKIPVYHTDDLAYKKKWSIKATEQEFKSALDKIIKKDKWIIEGVHTDWAIEAIKKADAVILLNTPKRILLKRAMKKLKETNQKGIKPRLKFIYWIYRWNIRRCRRFGKKAKLLVELKTDKEKEKFLEKPKCNQ